MNRKDQHKLQLLKKLHEIENDVGVDYILYALKKINDQQMFFLPMPSLNPGFLPILRLLDEIIREIEALLFNPIDMEMTRDDLKANLREILLKYSKNANPTH